MAKRSLAERLEYKRQKRLETGDDTPIIRPGESSIGDPQIARGKLWWVDENNELQVNFAQHEGQTRTWQSRKRYVAMIAGSQGGKTSFGPLWLWREIQERGPGDYMVVTPTAPLAKLKALPEFLRLFRDTLHAGVWKGGSDKYFAFNDGETRVIFGTATNPESLESATAKAVWLDECGQVQFHLESWEAIERRLALNMGRALLTTTPYNLGWLLHRIVKPWQDGDPDIDVINFPSVSNPAFPAEADERQRRVLPEWKYQMFYRGKMTHPAGMIYGDSYDDDWWRAEGGGGRVINPFYIPPQWPRYIGIDFGGANTAILWIAHDVERDVFIIYREARRGGLSAIQHVDLFRKESYGENVQRVWGGAKGESQQRLEWQQAGLYVEGPPEDLLLGGGIDEGIVEAGISRVIELWRTRRLLVFSNLLALRSELGAYSRKLDELGNPTNEILDKKKWHLLDALRYVGQNLSGPLIFRPIFGFEHAGSMGGSRASSGRSRRAA